MASAREPGWGRVRRRDRGATLAGLMAPLALATVLVPVRGSVPNTSAALALVLVVVAVAAAGRRLAGITAAVSAAVWFDFFLTVPYERFTITRRADIETTVLIVAVGIAVTEIAVRRRRQHTAAARRAGYLDGISAVAGAVATGAEPQMLVEEVCGQLTLLLGLSACRFQNGAAGIGRPPRLLRDGRIVVAGQTWDVQIAGMPPGRDTELLAEVGGLLVGRFLLSPGAGRPALEQRRVAVGLADQAGAALASARLARLR
jgi:K+-sensing histidine kinase KdpD